MTPMNAFAIILLCLGHAFAHGDEAFLPSSNLCSADNSAPQDVIVPDDTTCPRAWFFPDMRINMVCRYDFRREFNATATPYQWHDTSDPTIQATWGAFYDYVLGLVPELGSSSHELTTSYSSRIWMHGREGRPGWEIPPCDTNRTQATVHMAYLAVYLNESTTDPDLYNAGLPYETVNRYITVDAIRQGLTQYVCNDLESVTIGIADGTQHFINHPAFYPHPEDICPRVSSNDDLWDDTWFRGFILAVAGTVVLVSVIAIGVYCYWRRQNITPEGVDSSSRQRSEAPHENDDKSTSDSNV